MNNTFLSQFLMISDIKTIIFIALLIAIFIGVNRVQKTKIKFSLRILISMGIGLILGLIIQLIAGFPDDTTSIVWIGEVTKWYGLIGYGFMDLLKMLVIPLVFISIIRVFMNMERGNKVRKLSIRTISMLLGTTAVAAIIGIIVGNLFGLGLTGESIKATDEIREIVPVVDTLRGLLPSNPVKAMVENKVVAVIIFAGFLGLAIGRLRGKHLEIIKPAIDLVEASYKVITSVAITVIKFMPYAVVTLLANTIAEGGIASILSVLDFIFALYVSIVIMFAIHLIIVWMNGLNPIQYLKNVTEPLVLAFTSCSSLGTLPVTIETLTDKAGVNNGIASFVGSFGANIGMNGCAAIYPALVTVTLANMSGTHMDLSFYIMLILIIVVGSLGIAGLPGVSTMAMSVVVTGMGLGAYFPLIGGILAIDPILDMGRTMLNVNGTMTTAVTVSKSLNELDKEVFNN